MFKKALQIAVTFSLLLGGYAGYTRLFVIATALLTEGRDELMAFPEVDTASAKKATALAKESFGADHWAAQDTLRLNYIEEARGFFFYGQDHKLQNERKQMVIAPFAMIWVSADGKSHKTATSDSAVIDMSAPILAGGKAGSESSHITHAKLVGNVQIRDDKGTHADRSDDLRIGPMAQLDYDEATLQITSDSDIFLEDRDLWLTGQAMMIQLRRKLTFVDPNAPAISGGGSGFDAESIYVYKDVHLVSRNVGANGMFPGPGKPEPTGKTPFDLRCDRTMKIDLPPPHPPLLVGPPYLDRKPEPTFAYFKTNVRVIRGTDKSDELNCDTLDVTLMPKPRPPETVPPDGEGSDETPRTDGSVVVAASATPAPAPSKSSGGPLSDLQLHKAIARGDSVWISSEAQGLTARCVELIHQKRDDGSTDYTYLNGGVSTKLYVEKIDYDLKAPTPGTLKSILVLRAQDATIFDCGPGSSKVIARGPGRADERPARNAPIQRTAYWEDEMELLTWREGDSAMPPPHAEAARALSDVSWHGPSPNQGTLRRVITLTGVSKLVDHGTPTAVEAGATTTLDARRAIVAEFQAAAKLDPKAPDNPTEIKWLDAYKDAHLTAPSKTLTARDYLTSRFWPNTPAPAASPPATSPSPAMAGPAPVVAASVPPPVVAKPDPAPATPEPAVDGRADRIWANILMGAAGAKSELKNAMLRGSVMVHQDPAPGKVYPNEASGEAIDLTGQGKGLMKFAVKREEPPHASDPKTKLASNSKGRRSTQFEMARVDFEGKSIESEDHIGLDQKRNLAWAEGAGRFTQLNDRGIFDDKGLDIDNSKGKSRNGGPTPQDKMVITWNDQMLFYGNSMDLDHRPAAKIEFRGSSKDVRTPSGKVEYRRGVVARMTESVIDCDSMDVYMDRTIDLARDTRKSAPKSSEPKEPDPQIAMLDCKGQNQVVNGRSIPGVDIVNEKKYPGTSILKEKQRIQGVWVVYDKRTGEFEAPGPGTTWLYQRDGKYEPPVASANPRAPKPVVPPMKLTKVQYVKGMQGRFGVARDQVDDQCRDALFLGSAQAANASVASGNSDINFDDQTKAKDWTFLTSEEIHVYTEPIKSAGSEKKTRQLLYAHKESTARTIDSTIQADRITYDSSSELMYAYGEDDKEVSLTRQESIGQTPSPTRGKTLRFNKKTHASAFDDPQFIQFTDLKSGIRPKPYYPDLGGSPTPFEPPKPVRLPFMRTQRSSTERKTFSGGQ